MISTFPSVQYLLDISARKGIEHVVISPGSRNAPLTVSFANDERFKLKSIPDERSASFVALGLAQATHKPAIVTCTSGSAVVNLSGGILEAYYQGVPMIVVTADRPAEWTDQGDGQTMRQQGVFSNYIKASFQVPQRLDTDDEHWYAQRIINEAFEISMHGKPGPVHVNMPFAEPLYDVQETGIDGRNMAFMTGRRILNDVQQSELAEIWKNSKKKMILVGSHFTGEDIGEPLKDLSHRADTAVVTETTSNIRYERFNKNIDRLISSFKEDEVVEFMPDLLVTIGDHIVSKKIKHLLRKHQPSQHWHIASDGILIDTFKSLTKWVQAEPRDVLKFLMDLDADIEGRFGLAWKERDYTAEDLHEKFLEEVAFSDLKAFERINDIVPESSIIQMSNSTAVRYVQLFSMLPNIRYLCNRGVSGIDGSTSTALGCALESDQLVTLITGEVGFLYDSNALFNQHKPQNLRIIVINNGGGDIFRIIDGPSKHEKALAYFQTPHDFDLEHISEQYGLAYLTANNEDDLDVALNKLFYELDEMAVLEVDTKGIESHAILKAYFEALKQ